jgi:hypothetical protein
LALKAFLLFSCQVTTIIEKGGHISHEQSIGY